MGRETGTQVDERGVGDVVLKAVGISKHFAGVTALDGVDLEVRQNEIVGLVGDNGAGKSTLIKVISGNHKPDEGTLLINGEEASFSSPMDARNAGVETVYQDLSLCEELDAVANLFIGREIYTKRFGFRVLSGREMERSTKETLGSIGAHLPSVREKVIVMSGGQRQSIALGRATQWGRTIALLDEPTAALGVRETAHALDLITRLRQEHGTAIVLISHNLQHVFRIVDRIVVLRHGKVVGNVRVDDTTPDHVVSLITGAAFINSSNDDLGEENLPGQEI